MMTAQQLKNSILQRAIEGKLVEQRPEEGTAKELLKEIKLEKEKLVKEGKIKKSKSLPAITEDEIPFEIPDSWVWVRWGDLSQSIQYGYNAPAQPSGRIKMVRISDIQDNEVLWDTVPYCSIEDKDIETYLLQPDDILFARTGGTVGKSYLVDKVPEEAIYAGYLIRTRYSKLLVPRYLKTFMESALYWEQLKNGTIATAQPNCNGKTLANMIIPLPPLSEQHRIVAKIEELLPLVDQYDKAYSQLTVLNEKFPQDMKKSILQYAIEGKLVEQRPEEGTAKELLKEIKLEKEKLVKEGKIKKSKPLPAITEDEIPFEIPESWEWCRLEEVLLSLTDGTHNTPNYTESGIPFLSVKNISSGKIDFHNTKFISVEEHEELKKRCYPQKGDILLSKVGTTGIPVAIGCNTEFSIFVSIALLKCTSDIDTYFLVKLLESPIVQEQCKLNTRGVGNKNWVLRDIANTIIPIPPLSEQRRIVERLEQLLPLCDKLMMEQ